LWFFHAESRFFHGNLYRKMPWPSSFYLWSVGFCLCPAFDQIRIVKLSTLLGVGFYNSIRFKPFRHP
jgi:hypothetical protein